MPDEKKLTREELAAALEAKARALRDNVISDEEVEKMSAGCSACCGGCQVQAVACFAPSDEVCIRSCVRSSPN